MSDLNLESIEARAKAATKWQLKLDLELLTAECRRLRARNEKLEAALKRIAEVNACDYEYQRWAKKALKAADEASHD